MKDFPFIIKISSPDKAYAMRNMLQQFDLTRRGLAKHTLNSWVKRLTFFHVRSLSMGLTQYVSIRDRAWVMLSQP